MVKFRDIDDSDPALGLSPIVRATEKTFSYIAENGGIGLTPSKAFKRNFVHWAAAHFDWPGYSENELFTVNKVLNEIDFMPLLYLHDIMIALKIGRHYKGTFKLTKAGEALMGHPGKIFGMITPFYLFEVNHEYLSRAKTELIGNWNIFLNVLSIEAENGIKGHEIRKVLYGEPDPGQGIDFMMSALYIQVLRPLCWAGILQQHNPSRASRAAESIFVKTPLWKAALQLDTDDFVKPATRH